MNETWKGFVFLDINDDLLEENHDLGYGLTLRKATLEEITDRQLEAVFRMWSERRGTSVFLSQRMPLPDGDNTSYHGSVLPNPEEWRHAVIECSGANISFWKVNLAFSISSADLRMGMIYEGTAYSTPFIEFPMLNVRNPLGAMFVDHKLPSLDDLPEIKQNISSVLENLSTEFSPEIIKIIHIFASLDNLPDSSQLKVLGYFAVIEGLLSHAPQNSDRVDSIQRQLIRNINLLNNRLRKIGREITFSDFGETKPENILKKLYAYRSSIAHGQDAKGPINNIGKMRPGSEKTDHLWIHDWVRNMTKKLLLSAIIESDLVNDLK